MEEDLRTRGLDALRWTGSALLVLAAFGLIGWWVADRPIVITDAAGGEPALEINLEPAPQAAPDPPTPSDAAASQSQASNKTPEDTQPPAPPPPDVTPPSAPNPDVPMPPPQPVEQPEQVVHATEASSAAASPDAVEAPIGTHAPSLPGTADKPPSRAVLTWQRLLIGRLEQAKRYPSGGDGRSGATRVAFSIDTSGRLLARRIITSSGSAALDEAALDLLRRCQPFPAPPRGTDGARLSFAVTIRYAR